MKRTLSAHIKRIGFALSFLAVTCAWGQWTEPELLLGPILSSPPHSKTWPSINSTGDTLYFSGWGPSFDEDLYYSYRYNDSLWSAGIRIDELSDDQIQISPSIGPGDSTLYFVTYEREGGYGSWDVWFSRRGQDGHWQTPENAGANVNSSSMEWGVFLSRDGEDLFVSSTRHPEYSGFLTIAVSHMVSSDWSEAVPLPGEINWFYDQANVTLPLSEDYLVLTSTRIASSRADLWLSNFSDSAWSLPERMDQFDNIMNENGASLSSDGNILVFASEDTVAFLSKLYVSYRTSNTLPRRLPSSSRSPHLHAFPNPVNCGEITIKWDLSLSLKPAAVHVRNVLGQLVLTQPIYSENAISRHVTIGLTALANGIYFVSIAPLEQGATPIILIK